MSQYDEEGTAAPKRRVASKPLFDPQELHNLCLEGARHAIEGIPIPGSVETAFKAYVVAITGKAPRTLRNAESNLDRAIATNLEAIGGWDNANAIRNTYKSTLDTWIAVIIDDAHEKALQRGKDSLAVRAPDMEIPAQMAADLKKTVGPTLFPLKFKRENLAQLYSEAENHAQKQFVRPEDQGKKSFAFDRAASVTSGYIAALREIASRTEHGKASGLG